VTYSGEKKQLYDISVCMNILFSKKKISNMDHLDLKPEECDIKKGVKKAVE